MRKAGIYSESFYMGLN